MPVGKIAIKNSLKECIFGISAVPCC